METKKQTNEELHQQVHLLAERSQGNLMKIKLSLNLSNLNELESVLEKISNIHKTLIPTCGSDRVFEVDITLN
ncbi:hypothetical protein I6G82_02700 [Lysinibacillus macroides]|uniref:Uncharacterized protein n=1 Tax=Lysinibacillus macroides TaxID=33935 RepID=A0A0M9DH01_9BACI|nr:hypothetical protein [Lysinibacillus macroides]KOY81278.1 hypothetical protein ADM90_19275 [Lysinibacillus macroides]QPR68560.1 hypothetical protein I6G82_02700 [Lysinibacillus macroides]